MIRRPPRSTLFPYTRSSDLNIVSVNWQDIAFHFFGGLGLFLFSIKYMGDGLQQAAGDKLRYYIDKYTSKDRKSTRLNSSHANISYAVFCLKKKIYKCQVSRT